ncbi:hypothetical protein IGK74_002436 [Enterococcus sp. AZ150]
MALFPEVNERSTRKKVKSLLRNYRYMKRRMSLSDDHYNMIGAIQYSDMPKSTSGYNGQEAKTIKLFEGISKEHQQYILELNKIDKAISCLPLISQAVLRYSYCTQEKYTINALAAKIKTSRVNDFGRTEEVQYSAKNIEKLKNIALIEFAEAYDRGSLLVINKCSEKK